MSACNFETGDIVFYKDKMWIVAPFNLQDRLKIRKLNGTVHSKKTRYPRMDKVCLYAKKTAFTNIDTPIFTVKFLMDAAKYINASDPEAVPKRYVEENDVYIVPIDDHQIVHLTPCAYDFCGIAKACREVLSFLDDLQNVRLIVVGECDLRDTDLDDVHKTIEAMYTSNKISKDELVIDLSFNDIETSRGVDRILGLDYVSKVIVTGNSFVMGAGNEWLMSLSKETLSRLIFFGEQWMERKWWDSMVATDMIDVVEKTHIQHYAKMKEIQSVPSQK